MPMGKWASEKGQENGGCRADAGCLAGKMNRAPTHNNAIIIIIDATAQQNGPEPGSEKESTMARTREIGKADGNK